MAERPPDLRDRIVRAAADLLTREGRAAVSTRAVSAAAGAQPPAIYRQFGDMDGLLHAAAREVLARYVRHKSKRGPGDDPVEELCTGWDAHIAFGLANPDAYALIYAGAGAQTAEMREGDAILHGIVTRIAQAGRLAVTVPHATRLIQVGANGVVMTLLATPPDARDPGLSDAVREMVMKTILAGSAPKRESGPRRLAARAVALRAVLDEAGGALSAAERQLLGEWLDRLATARS